MTRDTENKTITLKQNTAINVSVALLIMFSGALITATLAFADLQNKVLAHAKEIPEIKEDIVTVKAENIILKVELTKVQTQLTSIEGHLLDIKQAQLRMEQ